MTANELLNHKIEKGEVALREVKQQKADLEKQLKTAQAEIARLTRELAIEKKDCIQALQERDYNGLCWRHFESICAANNLWTSPGIDKASIVKR